ncbi:ribosomal protein L22/L17 [Coniochaeta sp. 2T2.1]|nr:ribosomal protein L22/L17 [Coniochaeta sp. 2T2.1]
MSLNMPTRRLLQSAGSSLPSTTLALQHLSLSQTSTSSLLPLTQRRTAWFSFGKKKGPQPASLEPLSKELASSTAAATDARMQRALRGGQLAQDSIFSDEAAADAARAAKDVTPVAEDMSMGLNRDRSVLARATDPDPKGRARWERKMVIRHVAKATDPFSKESRQARILRTEKELRQRSAWMPTSVKKLVHLSRQIAGKSVEEALVQMRYSKKKMAKEVAYQIELARDRAVVERGMGIGGGVKREAEEAERKVVEKIVTKDGRHVEVEDPTSLYIAQSWVERGPWRGHRKSPRARGRMDLIKRPSTGLTVLLKEQKTLVREHKEREEKKYRQGPWEHLPNRPVTAQRQHYSW